MSVDTGHIADKESDTIQDVTGPVPDAAAPTLDAAAPILDAAAPVLDAAAPVLDTTAPIPDTTKSVSIQTEEHIVSVNLVERLKSLICPICLQPPMKPTYTPCQHLFCMPCLTTSVSRKEECPVCRAYITNSVLRMLKVNTAVMEELETILARTFNYRTEELVRIMEEKNMSMDNVSAARYSVRLHFPHDNKKTLPPLLLSRLVAAYKAASPIAQVIVSDVMEDVKAPGHQWWVNTITSLLIECASKKDHKLFGELCTVILHHPEWNLAVQRDAWMDANWNMFRTTFDKLCKAFRWVSESSAVQLQTILQGLTQIHIRSIEMQVADARKALPSPTPSDSESENESEEIEHESE